MERRWRNSHGVIRNVWGVMRLTETHHIWGCCNKYEANFSIYSWYKSDIIIVQKDAYNYIQYLTIRVGRWRILDNKSVLVTSGQPFPIRTSPRTPGKPMLGPTYYKKSAESCINDQYLFSLHCLPAVPVKSWPKNYISYSNPQGCDHSQSESKALRLTS